MTEVLYAARGQSLTTSDLYTVDPTTAVATSVGPIGFALTGLAEDPTNGTLYGSTSTNSGASPTNLITVSKTTGAGTLVGSFNVSGETMADICFNSAGQMYGWGSSRNLFTINKTTGQGTLVGGPAASDRFAGGLDFLSSTLYHADANANIQVGNSDISVAVSDFGDASARTAWGWKVGFALTLTIISELRVVLSKVGTPTDNVIFRVYDDSGSGGSPGSILFTYTIPASSFTSGTIYMDTGLGGLPLSNPNSYWFVLSRSGAVDPSNYYRGRHQTGTNGAFFNGSTWGAAGTAAGPWINFRTPFFTWTVNPATAGLTKVADYSGYAWSDTGFQAGAGSIRSSDGLMWLIAGDSVSSRLMTIDLTTGVSTHIGDSSISRIDALAWTGASVTPTLPVPQGLCIAFSAGPLDTVTNWTRIDE